jgi:PHP family Zn ribbon phosphoesterase
MRGASSGGDGPDILRTLEFFPQEGKYHYDGHRKCGARFGPQEAGDGLCPVCGKPLTMGVLRRVTELAGSSVDERAACPPGREGTNKRPYLSLIPLRELAAELLNTGTASGKVEAAYMHLVKQAGGELPLLADAPVSAIEKMDAPGIPGEKLAEAVSRMRSGQVFIEPGYDGVYGVVRVFPRNGAGSGNSSR